MIAGTILSSKVLIIKRITKRLQIYHFIQRLSFMFKYKNLKPRFVLVSLILSFSVVGAGTSYFGMGENDSLTPKQTIDRFYKQIHDQFKNGAKNDPDSREQQLYQLVDELFAVERLAPQMLQKKWKGTSDHQKKAFMEAIKISLRQKILTYLNDKSNGNLPGIKLTSSKTNDNVATLNYSLEGVKEKKEITLYMLKYPDGSWRISNLKAGKRSLLRDYYSFCSKIIKKYSLAYLIAEMTRSDYVILEDFESSEVGKLPRGWLWKKSDNKKNKPYKIVEEKGNKFLAAEDNGESVILGKDIVWNLKKYPYISFRWRVHHVPAGGDERYSRSVDSAAGIYIIYKKKLGLIPESVKYVWSTTLPVGAAMQRSGIGKPWNIVADSGEEHLGEWRTYTFNAYEAYKKTFGGKPPARPVGIGILSDANSTNSKAYADYDDIRALKEADADSGVKEKLKAE